MKKSGGEMFAKRTSIELISWRAAEFRQAEAELGLDAGENRLRD